MKLRFGTVPFSYPGSYMAFSYPQDDAEGNEHTLTVRNIHGKFADQDNYLLYFVNLNGEELPGEVTATETELHLKFREKELYICFQNEDTVWIKSNAKVMLRKRRHGVYDRVMCHDYGTWEVTGEDASLMFEVHSGWMENVSVWAEDGISCKEARAVMLPGENGEFICQMTLCGESYTAPVSSSYEEAADAAKVKFEEYYAGFAVKDPKYRDAVREAVYILWSSIVKPEGYVKYPAILMSKNKMNMVWSWDYVINALALAGQDPQLAYDQFLAMAACQDETGTYPDCFSAKTMIRGFVKPPVQGFALRKLFAVHKPEPELMEKLYASVSAFTSWWFNYRGRKDGIPEYLHGNDSGWDNSTVFSLGLPVKSPDLCTWLIEQMDFLSETALELGRVSEAEEWKQKSSHLLSHMLDYFVKDGQFTAYKIPENSPVQSDSLLMYIPLLLGKRLPEEVRQSMLDRLLETTRYFTPYGLASEPLDSPWFVEDGYWRGAVWPPTAWIFTEILMRNGKYKEAYRNAESFCEMCAQQGFFENYSALDGHGLRDSGYSWTAGAFMILLRDYLCIR